MNVATVPPPSHGRWRSRRSGTTCARHQYRPPRTTDSAACTAFKIAARKMPVGRQIDFLAGTAAGARGVWTAARCTARSQAIRHIAASTTTPTQRPTNIVSVMGVFSDVSDVSVVFIVLLTGGWKSSAAPPITPRSITEQPVVTSRRTPLPAPPGTSAAARIRQTRACRPAALAHPPSGTRDVSSPSAIRFSSRTFPSHNAIP